MKLRNKTRSDAAVVPYTHSATRITWSVNGYVKGARLYAVFCDVCGKEAGLRSVGEINRCKRSSLRLLCSDQCRKRIQWYNFVQKVSPDNNLQRTSFC